MNHPLNTAGRVVVKIGSALLVDSDAGTPRQAWLAALAADIAGMRARGQEVVVVSSGAIALGRRSLRLPKGTLKLEESQAAAAAGQIRLAHAYESALGAHGIPVAQVLVTLSDTEERRRYLNARNTLSTLLKHRAVPVINENDTVATDEIKYGDNDSLAARIAQMIGADVLVLLSDIDGLYTGDPRHDPTAEFLPHIRGVNARIEAMAGKPGQDGTGGMVTKLVAAKIALGAGCHMLIASGHQPHALQALLDGSARCTWFESATSPRTAYKQWIAGSLRPKGRLRIDAGAAAALGRGRSLLPAGVRAVEEEFQRGDAVLVADLQGRELARGLVAYDSDDARRIAGHKSAVFEDLLGYRGRQEMIHRDDLVLTAPSLLAAAPAKTNRREAS
ncbi:MAG: glutamate 5-kinase [Alphaproteobacteria bacterium]|nr:glutamate 5-kinase [Alphaproteobacteria bacterium]MCB9930176.1 glutamate 5-kinase [Alphaproteobacteria bacterium]